MTRLFPKRDRYDVVVVGAGPAGSIAARDLSRRGRSVLVLDRRQEIGAPKRCGEGIPHHGLERVGLTPHPNWAMSEITGAEFVMPAGGRIRVDAAGRRDLTGVVVERKVFEKHLASDAIQAGAEYLVKAQATGLVLGDALAVKMPKEEKTPATRSFREAARPRKWAGVEFEFMGEPLTVECDVVVGADGIDSSVGRWSGLNVPNSPRSYFSAFQYEMASCRFPRSDWLWFWFGNEIAPRGYVWAFPKAHGLWNVGVCLEALKSSEGKRARELTDAFIAAHPEHFPNPGFVEVNGSGIPMGGTLDHFTFGNVALVGDAAHLAHPLHGGGIDLAMWSGALCARATHGALAVRDKGKPASKWVPRLAKYESYWEATEGKRLRRVLKLREVVRALSDDDYDTLGRVVTGDDAVAISGGNWRRLLSILSKNRRDLKPILEKALLARRIAKHA